MALSVTLQPHMFNYDHERIRRMGAIKLLLGIAIGFVAAYGIYWLQAIGNSPSFLSVIGLLAPAVAVFSGLLDVMSNRPHRQLHAWWGTIGIWQQLIHGAILLGVAIAMGVTVIALLHALGCC
jgi:hypothetical protein